MKMRQKYIVHGGECRWCCVVMARCQCWPLHCIHSPLSHQRLVLLEWRDCCQTDSTRRRLQQHVYTLLSAQRWSFPPLMFTYTISAWT